MSVAVIQADASRLPLPDASVDLIVTSPPYWSLRAYTDAGEAYGGQIGAEPTPGEYVDALLRCTREWIRVLKPEGSLWVNLGDKYNAYNGGRGQGGIQRNEIRQNLPRGHGLDVASARPKTLLGLPWRYALGAVDQLGLILRAEVIWAKPNGMPESVTDRVRRSHEQFFHLVKQPRYFAAVDMVREPYSGDRAMSRRVKHPGEGKHAQRAPWGEAHALGSLPRSVWTVPTQPLKVPAHLRTDHYAAYPPKLIRRIVLGWSPEGICTACGQGRRPVVDHDRRPDRPGRRQGRDRDALTGGHGADGRAGNRYAVAASITGASCDCADPSAPTRPAVVLDPFGGTGTTALVADVHGRHGISVDASHDYGRIAQWRTRDPAQRARSTDRPAPVKRKAPAAAPTQGQDTLFGDGAV